MPVLPDILTTTFVAAWLGLALWLSRERWSKSRLFPPVEMTEEQRRSIADLEYFRTQIYRALGIPRHLMEEAKGQAVLTDAQLAVWSRRQLELAKKVGIL